MIKTNLKVTNFNLTGDIRDYLDKKLEKIGELIEHQQDEVILRVEIGRTSHHHKHGDVFKAEITTYAAGKEHRALSEREDILTAIDEAKDELIRSITHHKKKSETLARKGGRAIKSMIRKIYR